MKNKAVGDTLTRARTALIIDQPFYGLLALRLALVEDEGTKTLAVDGTSIRYNPNFILTLTIGQVKTALAHEVMHCVYSHFARRGDRNPRKFNQAGDYVINLGLKGEGFEPIQGWLLNPGFANMTTDHVYSLLPEEDENDGLDPLDDCMDAEELSEHRSLDWKLATVQAAKIAKDEGKLPGALARFVEQLVHPKADWRAILRRFITEISRDDYSWMRPNKRFQAQGIFLPSLYSESLGEIVVVIDTSGSIDEPTLNMFGSEIKAIIASTRPIKTHVVYCDSDVNHVDEFGANDEIVFDIHGGGGTDFRPPFIHLEKNNVVPACLVYLTDLYGPHGEPPSYPVMWVSTTPGKAAPWGETIEL